MSLDKTLYDRILKETPTFKFISQSILIERLKINGSLARVAIRHLEKEKLIKRIVHHSSQLIYSESIRRLVQFRVAQGFYPQHEQLHQSRRFTTIPCCLCLLGYM